MSRRVRVPAADDIFRPTVVGDTDVGEDAAPHTPSGRVRHDEKMTVYVTSDELLAIEDARLQMRRSHGLAVDRGRLVRAAVALALADLDEHGADSPLVKRLSEA